MDNIYIHPNGLAGNWTRASGKEYDSLRKQVKKELAKLIDPETNQSPFSAIVDWEKVEDYLNLPKDRVGDLVIANKAGYGWNEEMSEELEIFEKFLISGYKQAVLAKEVKGMWTPFIVMGHGVKKSYEIKNSINNVDQYSTILNLLNLSYGTETDGRVITEIFE